MYETKALLVLLAKAIEKADTVQEAYEMVRDTANVEGVLIPEFKGKKSNNMTKETEVE